MDFQPNTFLRESAATKLGTTEERAFFPENIWVVSSSLSVYFMICFKVLQINKLDHFCGKSAFLGAPVGSQFGSNWFTWAPPASCQIQAHMQTRQCPWRVDGRRTGGGSSNPNPDGLGVFIGRIYIYIYMCVCVYYVSFKSLGLVLPRYHVQYF